MIMCTKDWEIGHMQLFKYSQFLHQVPVEELVSGMVSHLPLKEDLEEYELVFKAFLTLYSAGHAVTPQCIPKIVESAAHFTTAHNVDKTKVGASLR